MKTINDLRSGKLPNVRSIIKFLLTVLVLFCVQLVAVSPLLMMPSATPHMDLSTFISYMWLFWRIWFPFNVIGLIICPWVLKDAKEQEMPRAIWVFACLFLNVIGLGLYLVFRIPGVKRHTSYESF